MLEKPGADAAAAHRVGYGEGGLGRLRLAAVAVVVRDSDDAPVDLTDQPEHVVVIDLGGRRLQRVFRSARVEEASADRLRGERAKELDQLLLVTFPDGANVEGGAGAENDVPLEMGGVA